MKFEKEINTVSIIQFRDKVQPDIEVIFDCISKSGTSMSYLQTQWDLQYATESMLLSSMWLVPKTSIVNQFIIDVYNRFYTLWRWSSTVLEINVSTKVLGRYLFQKIQTHMLKIKWKQTS